MTGRKFAVLLVAGLVLAVGFIAMIGSAASRPGAGASPAAATTAPQLIRLNDVAGSPVGTGGLAVGSYRVVDDSANDINGPGAPKQLSAEARLNLSREMGYGDDGTWCGWWVGKDPEGTDSVAADTVANDDEVLTLTSSMVGLTLWGDCVVTPVE